MKVHKLYKRSLEAQAGDRTVWELPFPQEAEIKSLVIKQQGGTDVAAFSVDIYDSNKVLQASMSSGGADPDGSYTPDPELSAICDTFVVTGNKLRQYYVDGGGLAFSNQDGGSSNKERKIYVEINIPDGTGLTIWDIAIRAFTDIG